MRTYLKVLLLASLLMLVAAGGVYAYAGYYNGPLFRDLPASQAGPDRPAIVIFSGDMGNRIGMSPKIAGRLNRRGYAVVTVNSLTFYSRRRDAEDSMHLIMTAMIRAMRLGHTERVVLVGQSFGADMLHAGLARLPAPDRRPVRAAVLVVPGDDIVFRASPMELAGFETPDQTALSTAATLTWVPLTCIHGAREPDSLCPLLVMPNVRRVTLPGGHRLDFDDAALERAILPAVRGAAANRSE